MFRNSRFAVLLLLCAITLAGCSTQRILATFGFGTAPTDDSSGIYYARGDLEATLDSDMETVYWGSYFALADRGYTLEEFELTAVDGKIEGLIPATGTEKEKKIKVRVKRTAQNTTEISIRINIFGDEALSRDIMEAIQTRLEQ